MCDMCKCSDFRLAFFDKDTLFYDILLFLDHKVSKQKIENQIC